MKKKSLKVIALTLVMALFVSSCGTNKNNPNATDNPNGTTKPNASNDTPLVVGYLEFSEKFSPFFAESGYDQDVATLTQATLLTTDRVGGIVYEAIKGETRSYNGKDYTYNGIADFKVTQDKDANRTTYNIKLRDDIKFSDGEALTADDVIFSFYVLCDTDYDGSSTLYSQPIVGLKNYRANSTLAAGITSDDINKVLKEMPAEIAKQIKEQVILPVLTGEQEWCAANWEAYKEDYKVNSAEEFFAVAYGPEGYDVTGKDAATILKEIAESYGTDYATLGSAYGEDLSGQVNALVEAYIIAQKTAAGEGEEVPNIEGIKKLGDYEIEITTEGYDATTIYQLGIQVAPLHYYGSDDLYDYDNNKFGFERGNLGVVRDKTTKPLGAGPYKYVKYENKVVYFEANENYFQGAPKTKYVQFKTTQDADKIPGVQQGTIDVADPSGSKAAFEQISGINSNGTINGDKIETNLVDNLGYGYIGINADTVKVGDKADSTESKNLRKALATVFSVYRDVAIDSYYGDAASVINYPISNTSWAAPQKSDSDYEVAFSKDVTGKSIYTDDMTADQKYEAALTAALGYFEAAGYTVADGKVTAAPVGAKTTYEIIIPAGGSGDHPSFNILGDTKEALAKIGITLEINDPSDSNILWNRLKAGTQELWTAAWGATIDPDMYQVYYSESKNSNHYHIKDAQLDKLILDARTSDDQAYRKSVYKECLNIIMDWSVEIPVYQRQNCVIYSPERVDASTFTPDVTTFYGWLNEIHNVVMK